MKNYLLNYLQKPISMPGFPFPNSIPGWDSGILGFGFRFGDVGWGPNFKVSTRH